MSWPRYIGNIETAENVKERLYTEKSAWNIYMQFKE